MSWLYVGGTVISLGSSFLNKKKAPKYEALEKVDPQEAEAKGLQGNLANLPAAQALSRQSALGAQSTALEALNISIPGFSDFTNRLTSLASSRLDDPSRLPDDVVQNVQQQVGEMGLNTGISGQAQDFNLSRHLGMTSLETESRNINEGIAMQQAVIGMMPQLSVTSPLQSLISPQERFRAEIQQNANEQGIKQSQADISANVDNWNRGNIAGAVASAGGALAGGVDWSNLFSGGSAISASSAAAAAATGASLARPANLSAGAATATIAPKGG